MILTTSFSIDKHHIREYKDIITVSQPLITDIDDRGWVKTIDDLKYALETKAGGMGGVDAVIGITISPVGNRICIYGTAVKLDWY